MAHIGQMWHLNEAYDGQLLQTQINLMGLVWSMLTKYGRLIDCLCWPIMVDLCKACLEHLITQVRPMITNYGTMAYIGQLRHSSKACIGQM